jgi:RNA polymerase sigma factor (sigma-70 family)
MPPDNGSFGTSRACLLARDSGFEPPRDSLDGLRSDSSAAREAAATRCLPILRRFAHGRLPRRARSVLDTDDLVQDTLARALGGLDAFEPRHRGALLAYLRQILLNRVRDEARRVAHRPPEEPVSEEVPDPGPGPFEQLVHRDVLARYGRALADLPARGREAVILRVEMGWRYATIAAALGRPSANAARLLTARSLGKLAERLGPLRAPSRRPATREPASWGSFRLLERIGRGSFGEVFRAHGSRARAEVALKLFRPSPPRTTESVLAEARRLARIRHPNVLRVLGADEHEGRAGMWSELLTGRTLEDLASSEGRPGPRDATVIGIEVCRALAAVHAAGLIHGDVKAANVMRAACGRIVLMDFGSAAASAGVIASAGTPIAMAPERLEGGPLTRSTDLYALGVLLYHLVTGRYPVEAKSIEALRCAHRAADIVPLHDRRAGLPMSFLRVVARALSPRPEDRYSSAGEMERALAEPAPGSIQR